MYAACREKVWRTIRQPCLLILDYEMCVRVERVDTASFRLTTGIDYRLPRSGLTRLLAAPYTQWCLDSVNQRIGRFRKRDQA